MHSKAKITAILKTKTIFPEKVFKNQGHLFIYELS
jgi:hypothetical protein